MSFVLRLISLSIYTCGSIFLLLPVVALAQSSDTREDVDPITVTAPTPVIELPGLQLSPSQTVTPDSNVQDVYIDSPFLAEYLAAIYRYAIGAAVVICIVVVMISGVQWTLSGGNAGTIDSAKKRITGAITGMLLAIGSYAILYTINPNLLSFRSLQVLYVKGIDIDNLVIEDRGEPPYGLAGSTKAVQDTTFDSLFKAFANCPVGNKPGINWKYLKAVAHLESGFNHTIVNSFGFTGLFQVGPKFCSSIIQKRYPAWNSCGTTTTEAQQQLKDPVFNTAVGTANVHNIVSVISNVCPQTTDAYIMSMLAYFAHNSGAGALQSVINSDSDACESVKALEQGIIAYWLARPAPKTGTSEQRAETRKNSAVHVATLGRSLGMTDFFDTSGNGTAACPLASSPSQFTWDNQASIGSQSCPVPSQIRCNTRGKRIIAIGDSLTQPSQYIEKLAQACGHTIVANKAVHSAKTGPGFGGPTSLKEQLQAIFTDPSIDLNSVDDLLVLGGANDIASGSALRSTNPQIPENNLLDIYKLAKTKHIRVIAITMTPWGAYNGGNSWDTAKKNRLAQLNNWIRNNGQDTAGNAYIDVVVDFYSTGKDGKDDNLICSDLTKDGIHLNAQGSSVLAELIASRAY